MRRLKEIVFMYLIPLMFISKVIEIPFRVNFSPADFLMLLAIPLVVWDLLKEHEWRKSILSNRMTQLFILLIVLRAISSIVSLFLNVQTLSITGMLLANLKFVISFAYFLAGIKSYNLLGKRKFLVLSYISTYIFVLTGLIGVLFFKFEWVMQAGRFISLVNDANIAALICILGILIGITLSSEMQSLKSKIVLLISTAPFGFGIMMAGSRTALLATALLGIGVLFPFRKAPKKIIVIVMVALLISTTMLIVETNVFESKNIDQFISRLFHETERAHDYRNVLSRMATEMGNDYWLTGIGTGQYPVNSGAYFLEFNEDPGDRELVTHNTFLSFYAENGVLGFLGYALLLGVYFKVAVNPYSRIYGAILIVYSLFFNIENIRFLWFFFGSLQCLESCPEFKEIKTSWKVVLTSAIAGVALSVAVMPSVYLPFNIDKRHFEITVTDELELYMEFNNPDKADILIHFDGVVKKSHLVRNDVGVYYERFSLPPGNYDVSFEVIKGDIVVNKLLVTEDITFGLTPVLGNWGPLIRHSMLPSTHHTLLENGMRRYSQNDLAIDEQVVQDHAISGLNYSNQMRLLSSELTQLGKTQYCLTLEFEKIGEIPVDYSYLFVGYVLNRETFGATSYISSMVTPDKPLTKIAVGSSFKVSWTFDTLGRWYLIFSGFHYQEGDVITRPLPIYLYHGYIQ